MQFGELAWQQAKEHAGRSPVVILPVGSLEAHGRHGRLETDAAIPTKLAEIVAEKTGSLVLPVIPYGHCYSLRGFSGTLSIRPETLRMLTTDIAEELFRHGFSKLLILNGHGGNYAPMKQALEEVCDRRDMRACIVSWWEMKEVSEITGGIGHADSGETSLYIYLTGKDVAEKPVQQEYKSHFGSVFPSQKGAFTQSGYRGSIEGISKEKGRKMADAIVKKLVELIKSDLVLEER